MTHNSPDKASLRNVMLHKRNSQPPATAEDLSNKVQAVLLGHNVWLTAKHVALYASCKGEVSTTKLLEDAWRRRIEVFLPRCIAGETGKMEFVPCSSMADLRAGSFGILQPKPELPAVAVNAATGCFAPDLFIIPALAYDMQGTRLGYGGGYYDRFLQQCTGKGSIYMGLAYGWQIVPDLPRDAWDYPLHCLCYEEGLIWM